MKEGFIFWQQNTEIEILAEKKVIYMEICHVFTQWCKVKLAECQQQRFCWGPFYFLSCGMVL